METWLGRTLNAKCKPSSDVLSQEHKNSAQSGLLTLPPVPNEEGRAGHCQSNLNPAQQSCIWVRSVRQLSPFSKRRIAALPEVGPTGEMTIEVEVVVDGGVDGDKLL